MYPIILQTKICVPIVHTVQVLRPRLFDRLETSSQGKLTLLSAPGGFGKTTLLSAWVKERRIRAAWLSLDKEDNEPGRFWIYFIAALQSVEANLGEEALARLRSLPPAPMETLLSLLLNEVGSLQSRFVLILDDFHVIEERQIQESILFFLEHLPQTLHLILSTRADPPWPLARLRARGEVNELRINDLRFTIEESTVFLNNLMNLALSAEDVIALDERTEGWIAGLQMSALSMQGRQDKSEFIKGFSGSHHYVFDFLMEEVLNRLPDDTQEFLLKTSILDNLTAPLCEAITQRRNSQEILMQLEKANLFLIPVDEQRRWYRYHPLFAEILRGTLAHQYPDLTRQLHRSASDWYAENGLISPAINHAFAAGNVEHVAQLIEKQAFTIITVFNEYLPALAAWLDALPEELLRSRPWLALARAWATIYSGELNDAEEIIQQAEQIIDNIAGGETDNNLAQEHLSGYLAAIRGYWFFMQGDNARGKEWMEKAIRCLPAEDAPTRVFSAIVLGATIAMLGSLDGGIRLLTEAADRWQGVKNPFLTIMILCELAPLQLLKGKLTRVTATCEAALRLSNEYTLLTGLYPPNIGFAYARLSYVLCEQNELEAALRCGQEAVKISRNWGQKDSLAISFMYLAFAHQAAGNSTEAMQMMNKARQVTGNLSGAADATAAAYEAKFRNKLNDRAFIIRWAEASGIQSQAELSFSRMREYLVYARALLVQEKLVESLAFLKRLLRLAETTGAMLFEIEILILQALVLHRQAKTEQAMVPLERALRLAEPEGYVRIFVEEGARMAGLLRQAIRRGISLGYAHRLLAVLEASPQPDEEKLPTAASCSPPGVDASLTRREIEILKMLMTSQSVDEIADELCITINTLRTHIRNIYAKLGVHNRMEAVTMAKSQKIS